MLEPHKYMWDGQLGTVTATQHRIQLTPGAQSVHAQPYLSGTRAGAAEQEEIQMMLAQDVIEPATCEWASQIVLVPKTDWSLRFVSITGALTRSMYRILTHSLGWTRA
jgi:hypothetical protein